MHPHLDTPRLGETPRTPSWWAGESPEIAAFEQHASEGCSVCARALVNGREAAVDLASLAPRVKPSVAARKSVLDGVRASLRARRAAAIKGGLGAAGPDAQGAFSALRVLDPSATVAHLHQADPGDAARIAEIDALRAAEPRPGEGSARMLEQLARFLDFSIFFVSIVRGDRATYRVQRGLPESLRAFRELRRDMSYCTHCMSAEAPLLVENGLSEPFFRGNKAATRFGVAAYAGAPLRTSRGIVIGTLCALDFSPRPLAIATSGVLEVFARRAVAEIERERSPELLPAVIEQASERADLHAAPFFRDLVAAQLARPSSRGASALLTVRASSPRDGAAAEATALLGAIDEHEVAGRLDATSFGLLLPNVDAGEAAARLARLRATFGDRASGVGAASAMTLGVALAPAGPCTADEWIASASL